MTENRPNVESAWFWIYLFSMAGLIGLIWVAPKIVRRQEQLLESSPSRPLQHKTADADQGDEEGSIVGERWTMQFLVLPVSVALVFSTFIGFLFLLRSQVRTKNKIP